MMSIFRTPRLLAAFAITLALAGCGGEGHDDADGHAHDEHGHDDHGHGNGETVEEAQKGPHGGRLLREGEFALELKIEESGTPPRYAAWAYRGEQPIDPAKAAVEVRLTRLGGQVDVHRLAPRGDRIVGSDIVHEPHSFEVAIDATLDGQRLRWAYDSFEGRTAIARDLADEAGIRVAAVAGGPLVESVRAHGSVAVLPGRQARVVARFPGVVRELRAAVGDTVAAGRTLAIIDSNASLSRYAVTSPIAGTVMERTTEVGVLAGEAPLFVVADLSTVAVDLAVFGAESARVRAGQPVRLRRIADGASAESVVEQVLPAADAASQSLVARLRVPNTDGFWRPGMAVEAQLEVARDDVPLRLPLSAIQRFRDWQVAFIRIGDTYEIRPLELGRSDGEHVEVREGLAAGDEVVVEQSFLVKADIEKSGASHDH
jgi:cobalt-zinc-cadmium efflux system membrane fusion protein